MNIDQLQAGRPLDAFIGSAVMGWQRLIDQNNGNEWIRRPDGTEHRVMSARMYPVWMLYDFAGVPKFSTDPAAAWTVVEMLRNAWLIQLKDCGGFGWRIEALSTSEGHEDVRVQADTMPLGVCRLAAKLSTILLGRMKAALS